VATSPRPVRAALWTGSSWTSTATASSPAGSSPNACSPGPRVKGALRPWPKRLTQLTCSTVNSRTLEASATSTWNRSPGRPSGGAENQRRWTPRARCGSAPAGGGGSSTRSDGGAAVMSGLPQDGLGGGQYDAAGAQLGAA